MTTEDIARVAYEMACTPVLSQTNDPSIHWLSQPEDKRAKTVQRVEELLLQSSPPVVVDRQSSRDQIQDAIFRVMIHALMPYREETTISMDRLVELQTDVIAECMQTVTEKRFGRVSLLPYWRNLSEAHRVNARAKIRRIVSELRAKPPEFPDWWRTDPEFRTFTILRLVRAFRVTLIRELLPLTVREELSNAVHQTIRAEPITLPECPCAECASPTLLVGHEEGYDFRICGNLTCKWSDVDKPFRVKRP